MVQLIKPPLTQKRLELATLLYRQGKGGNKPVVESIVNIETPQI